MKASHSPTLVKMHWYNNYNNDLSAFRRLRLRYSWFTVGLLHNELLSYLQSLGGGGGGGEVDSAQNRQGIVMGLALVSVINAFQIFFCITKSGWNIGPLRHMGSLSLPASSSTSSSSPSFSTPPLSPSSTSSLSSASSHLLCNLKSQTIFVDADH